MNKMELLNKVSLSNLEPANKVLLTELILRADEHGECFPSVERLCKARGIKHEKNFKGVDAYLPGLVTKVKVGRRNRYFLNTPAIEGLSEFEVTIKHTDTPAPEGVNTPAHADNTPSQEGLNTPSPAGANSTRDSSMDSTEDSSSTPASKVGGVDEEDIWTDVPLPLAPKEKAGFSQVINSDGSLVTPEEIEGLVNEKALVEEVNEVLDAALLARDKLPAGARKLYDDPDFKPHYTDPVQRSAWALSEWEYQQGEKQERSL